MITFIFLSFVSTALSQYSRNQEIKPDVTFGEENERFDIASIINDQNRFYAINQDFRRVDVSKEDILNALKDTISSMRKSNKDLKDTIDLYRRDDADFAYHDTMDKGGGTVEDFEMNLKKFQKNADEYSRKLQAAVGGGDDGRRRSPDPDDRVLMNHALPVQMDVKGYLQLPEEVA